MALGVLGTLGAIGSGISEAMPEIIERREGRRDARFLSELHRISASGDAEEMARLLEDPRYSNVSPQTRQRAMESLERTAQRKAALEYRERQFDQRAEENRRERQRFIEGKRAEGYDVETGPSDEQQRYVEEAFYSGPREGSLGRMAGAAREVDPETFGITSIRRGPELERQHQAKTEQAEATLAASRDKPFHLSRKEDREAFEAQSKIIQDMPTTKEAIEANRKFRTLEAILSPMIGHDKWKIGARHIAAMNSFQRMIDDAVVRSDDIKMLLSAQGLTEKWYTVVSNIVKGDVLSASLTEEMYSTAVDIVRAIHSVGERQIGSYVSSLEQGGLYSPRAMHAIDIAGMSHIPTPPEADALDQLLMRDTPGSEQPELNLQKIGSGRQ